VCWFVFWRRPGQALESPALHHRAGRAELNSGSDKIRLASHASSRALDLHSTPWTVHPMRLQEHFQRAQTLNRAKIPSLQQNFRQRQSTTPSERPTGCDSPPSSTTHPPRPCLRPPRALLASARSAQLLLSPSQRPARASVRSNL